MFATMEPAARAAAMLVLGALALLIIMRRVFPVSVSIGG